MEQDYDVACYPRWRYHRTQEPRIVYDVEQDKALGDDWANTPAAFYETVTATTYAVPVVYEQPVSVIVDAQTPSDPAPADPVPVVKRRGRPRADRDATPHR